MVTKAVMPKCSRCGTNLTEKTTWPTAKAFTPKHVPYCAACQQKFFDWLSSLMDNDIALFLCCAFFNVPYWRNAVEESKYHAEGRGIWGGYLQGLQKRYQWDKANVRKGFADGETDIYKALSDLTEEELEAEEKEDSVGRWGTGPEDHPYTQDEYEEMDRQFYAIADGRGSITEQTKLTIMGICKLEILKNRYLAAGEISKAKSISDMIRTEKEGEQLRKKDDKSTDIPRLDNIVLAVQRAGLDIMDPDELLTALANHSFNPKTKYPYTFDAADKMLLYIYNTTAKNEGMPEVESLPPQFSFIDDVNQEFAPEQDDEEKAVYKKLGIYAKGATDPAVNRKKATKAPKAQPMLEGLYLAGEGGVGMSDDPFEDAERREGTDAEGG